MICLLGFAVGGWCLPFDLSKLIVSCTHKVSQKYVSLDIHMKLCSRLSVNGLLLLFFFVVSYFRQIPN